MDNSTRHDQIFDTDHDDFGGLHRDLHAAGQAISRRSLFALAGRFGAGLTALQFSAGCGSGATAPTTANSSTGSSTGTGGSTGGACSAIPSETQGPYPADGSNGPTVLATAQIALPKTASDLVYALASYSGRATNLSRISLDTDNVFSDGYALELATVDGDVAAGMTASLTNRGVTSRRLRRFAVRRGNGSPCRRARCGDKVG